MDYIVVFTIIVFSIGMIKLKPVVYNNYQGLRNSLYWYKSIEINDVPTEDEWIQIEIHKLNKERTKRILWKI